jgi:hypothetical protein
MDGEHRGYVLLDVTPHRMQADYMLVPTVSERSGAETLASALVCERGSSHLVETNKAAPTQEGAPLAHG